MIRIYSDLESLSRGAAELFVTQAEAAFKARGRFSVALSGGSTPQKTYETLARAPLRDRIAWNHVHVFWGDERCVTPGDPRGNALSAERSLLGHVPVPAAQIHPIHCAESPEYAARQYEALLRSFFAGGPPRFDLILLGLGENGHTASLFPDSSALREHERWAAEVYVAEQALYRVTLTPPLINQAASVAFIVSGASKAQVLKEVLEGPRDPMRLPAQLVQPELHGGDVYWLVDSEAASHLKGQHDRQAF
ncbi:MAG: 6-phosphogluconolactonase [Syntrophobacteraceae bacterium]